MSVDRIDIAAASSLGGTMEPEEAPARRVLDLPVTMRLGSGPTDAGGPVVAETLVPVTADFLAGEVAQAVASRCVNCVHFRQEAWRATMLNWADANIGRRKILDRMIMNFARSISETTPTLEEIAEATKRMEKEWGVCAAITEERNDITITHPEGGCPEGVNFYRHRDLATTLSSSRAYDKIMRAAQGKT